MVQRWYFDTISTTGKFLLNLINLWILITWDFLTRRKRFHLFTAKDSQRTRFMAAMSRATHNSQSKSILVTTCTLLFSYSRTTWVSKKKIKRYLFRYSYFSIVVAVSLTLRVNHGLCPWYRKAYSVEQRLQKYPLQYDIIL